VTQFWFVGLTETNSEYLKLLRGTLVRRGKVKVYPCAPRHEKIWGRGGWRYSSTHSYTEVSGDLHNPLPGHSARYQLGRRLSESQGRSGHDATAGKRTPVVQPVV
jgi:hypothetical protein